MDEVVRCGGVLYVAAMVLARAVDGGNASSTDLYNFEMEWGGK
jgi:hypothetical protein